MLVRLKLSPEVNRRSWGDGTIVYHDGSSATHHLFGLEAWLLERIAERPATHAELVAAAAEVADSMPGTSFDQAVAGILTMFERLRLTVAEADVKTAA